MSRLPARITSLLIGTLFASQAAAWPLTPPRPTPHASDPGRQYAAVVRKVAAMPENDRAVDMVSRAGLSLLNVLWEDTGRWEGSSLGPNISDVTIEVEVREGQGPVRTALMPVMRHDNFTDRTGDVKLDKLMVPVGNQAQAGTLGYVSLRELLANPTRYMTLPAKGKVKGGSLLAQRDRHALVSAQATFLPVPREGQATFWPVIFNYQSTRKNPAVLTLLVTRQGTSMTIVDNVRDTVRLGSWGQRLFFNKNGQRTPLTAERLSDVRASGVTMNGESADSLGADANLMMIIQVPLKYRQPPARAAGAKYKAAESADKPVASLAAEPKPASRRAGGGGGRSDVETAVLGHGPELGPYTELDGLTIERDPRFPVRVTVQFYQATSNGVLAAADVRHLRAQIKKVYAMADYVGSLVVPTAGDRQRPTNWDGVTTRPPGVTAQDFPGLMQRREDAAKTTTN
jgi:hypothetical protein